MESPWSPRKHPDRGGAAALVAGYRRTFTFFGGTMVRAVEAAESRVAVGAVARIAGIRPSALGVTLAHATRVSIIATVVANVAYLGSLLLPGAPASALVDIWLSIIAQVAPLAVFWLVAVRTRFARWEVVLAAAGITFNAFGEIYYALAMDASGDLPSPSPADLGYLLYYPLTMAALIVLVRRQSRRSTHSVFLDSTLAVLGASAVLAVILAPVFDDATSGTAVIDGAIASLYPLFDLLLVAVVVGVSASPVLRIGPGWQYLVLGLLLFTGADIAYALLNHIDAYDVGTPLDAAWSAAVAFSALWVNRVDRREPETPAAGLRARTLPVPAIAVLAGLGVLILASQTPVPTIALVLAAVTVALAAVPVMFRQATLARLLEGQQQVVVRLTELDQSKSDMIGTVSHEMRTPLTSILGFLELVLDDAGGTVPDDAKGMLRVAERNAQRLHNLVGDMLMMSRLESGGASPATVPVEIARLLRRTVDSLRPLADSQEVALDVRCDESVIVEGDPGQLERVFTNVIENAVKFTPAAGSVRVDVTPGPGAAASHTVVIAVRDTGMGIPADELPQLFDRFYRASNARDEAVPGTGLGLSIVRGIVQAHHGDVSVDSTVGEGTTFRITLPVQQGAERAPATAPEPAEVATGPVTALRRAQ
jgi:signal transduction histidine kinase